LQLKLLNSTTDNNDADAHNADNGFAIGGKALMPALAGASPKAGKFSPNTMLMNNTSAKPTGLTALQLAAALTEDQWTELEDFADKRLRRSMNHPGKQRALAIYDGLSLVHTAIEQFALGDLGYPGGRQLPAGNRINAATFINAMHSTINSIINHALSRVEFSHEHKPIGSEEVERGFCEPIETASLDHQLEMRDLQQRLFTKLEEDAGGDQKRLTAVEALKNDCLTGHVRGKAHENVNRDLKLAVRQQAQAIWKNLTID
jgi:hypothetical protein